MPGRRVPPNGPATPFRVASARTRSAAGARAAGVDRTGPRAIPKQHRYPLPSPAGSQASTKPSALRSLGWSGTPRAHSCPCHYVNRVQQVKAYGTNSPFTVLAHSPTKCKAKQYTRRSCAKRPITEVLVCQERFTREADNVPRGRC